MKHLLEDVRMFMEIGNSSVLRSTPALVEERVRQLCLKLVYEEHTELTTAMLADDMPEIADGMADLIYVIVFAAHCYGIPLDKVWDAVQAANMAKYPNGVVLRRPEDGKILKPEGWTPPDIEGVLEAAGYPKGAES